MTLSFGVGLQAAVHARLVSDAALAALIGAAVYDAPPDPARVARLAHVTLGEERVRPFDTKTSSGAEHDFAVTVHSGEDGFATAKRIAAAVCAALVDAPLSLAHGKLVSISFRRATAERAAAPEKRRVSLMFRAIIDQDA
ncbi:DUF3168 domain-containing protein [Amaricoccus solimangrovi]|uniref:DUF3168 domain-containing protein n=1 Tax=Amaricoccus solimangrovi TaxID=2589815 RepID=A0A501WRL4_9RHOB|nr:DUF3168 domain-containing protein [Amaricoccus solimangrovi]TPE50724.1 DUF3168 domain-containing protein [Amaricoccus solimangrovi]